MAWSAVTAIGTSTFGIDILKDQVSIVRITAIAFIIFGMVLLNLSSTNKG